MDIHTKTIIFISGMPCSGKTTFINKSYKDNKNLVFLDLKEYQDKLTFAGDNDRKIVMISYKQLLKDMKKYIKEGKSIVIEHTLLKRKRREMYLKHIPKDYRIEMRFFLIDKDIFLERGKSFFGFNTEQYWNDVNEGQEIPSIKEGFDLVIIEHISKEN